MNDKSRMDTRTSEQIQTEAINTTIELQDEVEMLFAWKTSYNDNEIILSNDTLQAIIRYIKQLKEKAKNEEPKLPETKSYSEYTVEILVGEVETLKTSLMSLTQEVSMLKMSYKNQRKRALYERSNPYNLS